MADLAALFEAKTGHQEFPWGNNRAIGDREQQFAKQLEVAKYCKVVYFVAVDNPDGFTALKNEFPAIPIFYVPFGGGQFSDQ